MDHPLPQPQYRARAALSNASGRFERTARTAIDDGWAQDPVPDTIATELRPDASRTVIARNNSPDLPFDRSLNPYRGCEHGCVYCFARPTHAYLGMSPGLDFETRLLFKPDAARLLERELSRKGYRAATLAIGTNTDPYQPAEKKLEIMRRVLGVLARFRHPVAIVTKGALVRRDVDILAPMATAGLASVGVSLTTLDAKLARAMEPRAAAPATRLAVMAALAQAGIPVKVMIAPVIPGLTEHEIEALVAAAADAGAKAAAMITLRLPGEVSVLFREWLARHLPGRAAGIMRRVRELHGGRDYDPAFGARMTGSGPMAELLRHRFDLALRRHGLERSLPPLRSDLFAVPDRARQLSLF